MEKSRAIELLKLAVPIKALTQQEYSDFIEAVNMAIDALKAQLSKENTTKGATSDLISKFIDGLEETFAYIREREGGDSVCGLCEYDGAYIGQSGDWCNECPGFDRDDCFKLSEETRKKWTEEIIKALPSVQPEPAIPLSWIEKYIEWLKSFDNEFANLEAAHISVMVNKWRDEQNERTD